MKPRWALLACLAGIVATLATASSSQPSLIPLPDDSAYHLSATFTDSGGRAMAWRELRGKPRVATMFYASCRYICPIVVDSLRAVERSLNESQRIRLGFVLISMDPSRDTPETLAKLMSERNLAPASWLLLSPRPDEVRSIAGILGIRYRALADGEFNHTTTLVLLDSDGRVLARTDRIGSNGDPEFLAAVRTVSGGE